MNTPFTPSIDAFTAGASFFARWNTAFSQKKELEVRHPSLIGVTYGQKWAKGGINGKSRAEVAPTVPEKDIATYIRVGQTLDKLDAAAEELGLPRLTSRSAPAEYEAAHIAAKVEAEKQAASVPATAKKAA